MRTLVLLLALLALPTSAAHACWDGWAARTPRFVIQGPEATWSFERAAELATWLPRIEALLAARNAEAEVSIDLAFVRLPSGDVEVRVPPGKLRHVFSALARATGASPAERRAALAVASGGYTVQVAAARDEAAARRLAARLVADGIGEHGFYEAGGFPADNPAVHVVAAADEGGPVYRVVVGAFLDVGEARQVAQAIRAATSLAPFLHRL